VLLRAAALRSFLIISSTARRRQSGGSTVAAVEQLQRGRRGSGGMVEEGFIQSLDERDELVAGRYAVRLRFAGQGGVGRRVTRLLQRPDLGKVRKDDQKQYAVPVILYSNSFCLLNLNTAYILAATQFSSFSFLYQWVQIAKHSHAIVLYS
jgi:hypothetical protein